MHPIIVNLYLIFYVAGFVFIKYDFVLGEGQEKLSKFKKWFWSMVENMTSKQKQDLVWANLSFWIQWAGVKSEY